MDFRERTLRSFQKRKIDKIVWQPRIYYWYYGNGLKNRLPRGYTHTEIFDRIYQFMEFYKGEVPERYQNKSMLEIYDDLNASPRYPQEVLGVSLFRLEIDKRKVKYLMSNKEAERVIIYETPMGSLKENLRHGYHTKYPVKTVHDMKVMGYILNHTDFVFDTDAFRIADKEFGGRGPVQTFFPDHLCKDL